ncbi:UDP-N-acetylglucosamine 2-epimerase [Bacillus mesophilus]|uniref:UDP-N-acetylglucosamine 2-epimerase (Non-hydrolyzing) n=1 Tax=Bacillus mesophilus TaxID=1808955 RepID=A0A6M0Q946_9BACI|nr:UDP-N-acetylglucosamine 2-epimerase (non-hydrolyzing) [Bacillus mesophilus]MBM7661610.1 UDP-N-acetylglucosamine 2-epimerase [Bacillus mesophilus]NEY72279.1 UDP-N-acetylglucosamine 2-epimerase (non-hydrolyzing) [Bacillus mesophilus]
MKKILTIVGARPQFIKVAPVSRVLRNEFEEIIVNTGQHYDYNMSGVFFEELNIPKPNYDLGVGSGSHGAQTGAMLKEIEDVLFKEKPDAVLVYGDTNSTLAGAIAASKLHIPLFHIEAGLRSFNKKMPEEVNRILTDHVSSLLFAPTETAVENLKNEGVVEGVHNVGDVMFDAVLYNITIANNKYKIEDFQLESKQFVLATIHRAENTDDLVRLEAIFESLSKLEDTIVLPLHPRTKGKLDTLGISDKIKDAKNIKIIDPVSYLEMVFLESHSKFIITDSGGVQKEAYFAKVPCFTLRDQTEWVETVDIGWNRLVNPVTENLLDIVNDTQSVEYVEHLYGNGDASSKIVKVISDYLGK